MDVMCGIYEIVLNDKNYIGSAKDIKDRIRRHLSELRRNKHGNPKMQHAYNKCGEGSFSYAILEITKQCDLISREQHFIDMIVPYYNICKIAGNTIGRTHTEETKRHLSEIRKGKQPSLGRILSEETKAKIGKKAKQRGLHPVFMAASIKANTNRRKGKDEIHKTSLSQMKLSFTDVAVIFEFLKLGVRQIDLAKYYNVSQTVISRAKTGKGIYSEFVKDKKLDADYYRMAKQRLDDFIRQPRLDSLTTIVQEQTDMFGRPDYGKP